MTTTTNSMKANGMLLILALAPILYLVSLWSSLPDTVPLHWNWKGEADNYGSKEILFWTVLGLNSFIYVLLLILPRIAARKQELEAMGTKYTRLRFVLQLFVAVLSLVIVLMSSGQAPSNPTILLGGCFILFMLLFGNYVGSIRPNYFIGIRTPWTLQSDKVWKKTHRLAGRLLIGAALVGIILLLLLPSSWGMLGVTLLMLAALLIPVIYSFWLFRKLEVTE